MTTINIIYNLVVLIIGCEFIFIDINISSWEKHTIKYVVYKRLFTFLFRMTGVYIIVMSLLNLMNIL